MTDWLDELDKLEREGTPGPWHLTRKAIDLANENKKLRALLVKTQWTSSEKSFVCCLICRQWKDDGHTESCELAEALK